MCKCLLPYILLSSNGILCDFYSWIFKLCVPLYLCSRLILAVCKYLYQKKRSQKGELHSAIIFWMYSLTTYTHIYGNHRIGETNWAWVQAVYTKSLCSDSPNERANLHIWGTDRITGGFPNEFLLRVDGLVKDIW